MDVSLHVVVDFLKQREDWPRAYTVEHALPDDTRLVAWHWLEENGSGLVELELESDQWQGDSVAITCSPRVTVHLLDPVKMAQSLRDA